jgi:hypothetical protein
VEELHLLPQLEQVQLEQEQRALALLEWQLLELVPQEQVQPELVLALAEVVVLLALELEQA